jgi:predicted acylesterase/phospholipase RssA
MFNGLILSGGGVKGLCTLGSLQYLYDNKLIDHNAHFFSGTSIGGIISFFMAIGYTPIELLVYLCSHSVLESLKINRVEIILEESGIYDYSTITEHYRKMTLDKIGYIPTFGELYEKHHKELILCTYNLTKSKIEYLSYKNYPDMSCLDALRMTSNLPFIFGNFFWNNCEYLDGGFVDNFPLKIIPNDLSIFGVYLENKKNNGFLFDQEQPSSAIIETISWARVNKVIDKIYNILNIPVDEREKEKIENCQSNNCLKILKIELENTKIYKFSLTYSEKMDMFSIGYNSTKNYLK